MTGGGFGLASTVDDYMRLARMLLNQGEFDGARMLKPSTVKLMSTDQLDPRITDRGFLPGKGSVGLGSILPCAFRSLGQRKRAAELWASSSGTARQPHCSGWIRPTAGGCLLHAEDAVGWNFASRHTGGDLRSGLRWSAWRLTALVGGSIDY